MKVNEMVGVERSDANTWKNVVGNFLITFLAQFIFAANELLETGVFPTVFEVYSATVTSLVVTLGFYGVNKIIHRSEP